jgi:uncharacterized protein
MIFAVAGTAQAVTGFGFALLAVSLLAIVTDIQTTVVSSAMAALALTGVAMICERAYVDWGSVVRISVPAALGLPLGLVILETFPDTALRVLVAVTVLGSTWIVWRRPRIGGGWPTLIAIGLLTGVLTTSTGTNGPPLVAAFQTLGLAPRPFRATLATIFTLLGAASVILFVQGGEVGTVSVTLALVGLPAVVLGWWAGDHVFRRISADRFRATVLIALVITSAVTLVRSFI